METNQDLTYRIFTGKAEADKAINSLKGILQGIVIDQTLNRKELAELDRWAKNHQELIDRNPFREFIHGIRATLNDEIPIDEALDNMNWLCMRYEDENIYYNAVTADLQLLQGVCHGILSDGVINQKEVEGLQEWMNANDHLASYYPYDELYTVLQQILQDGVVDEGEKVLLKAYFNQFVRLNDKQLTEKIKEETASTKISALCSIDPKLSIDGKRFCITGKLTRGNRTDLTRKIEDWGGICCRSTTKDTDYLIVGDNGNPAWAFACSGRKVEQAMNWRKKGSQVVLVHEYDFWDYMDDLQA